MTDIRTSRPRRFPRIDAGVRGRLYGMVAGSVAMVAVASGVAWVSFDRVEATFAEVTGESLPVMAAAMRMTESSAEIAAAAPALSGARDDGERAAAAAHLDELRSSLAQAMDALRDGRVASEMLGRLEQASADIADNLKALDAAVADRLAVRAELEPRVAAAAEAHAAFLAALDPVEQGVAVEMSANSQLIPQIDDPVEMGAAITDLVDNDIGTLQAIAQVRADANLAIGLLAQAAGVTSAEALDDLAKRFEIAALRMERVQFIQGVDGIDAVADAASAFAAPGLEEGNVFALRARELELAAEEQSILAGNAELSGELRRQVARVVDASVDGAAQATGLTASSIADSRAALLLTLGATLIGALGVSWLLIHRGLVRRLVGLVRATRAVAEGDLETEVPVRGGDEIAEMAEAVRGFQANSREMKRLEAQQREMEAEAEAKRRAALEEVARSFEAQVKGVVERVAAAAGQMRETAEGIASRAESNRSRGTAAADASERANSDVQTVATAAEEMAASLEEISRQVSRSAQMARSAVDEAERTNGKVGDLTAAAERIGEVVGLISDIAEQTNLLALNATIEAARAGEAGKGFAVVAGEVKALASQTAKATEEIAAQVRAIQDETGGAAEAIRSIAGSIGSIDEAAAAIASAVEEQAAVTQDIARNTQSAAEQTRAVVDNVGQVSASAEEAGAAANTALGAAEELSEQSQRLSEEVETFLRTVRAA